MEGFSQHLDELTEIHASIGDIVEDGFIAVTLVLHIANLHLQPQVLGNLAAANHGLMLARLGLLVLLHIYRAHLAIDVLDVVHVFWRITLNLQQHKLTRHCHSSDVMSG